MERKRERQDDTSLVHSLHKNNSELQKQLEWMQLELLNHQGLKEKLTALQDSYTSLSDKHEQLRTTHKTQTQQLQQQVDEETLARRRVEEQLSLAVGVGSDISSESRTTVLKKSQSLLEEIQAKYSDELSRLNSEIRVKDKTLQDMRNKRFDLVSVLAL